LKPRRSNSARTQANFRQLLRIYASLGGGIWSMHFVAMIALELPFAVAYQPALTILLA
jgi:NO-binding membrane sensor protein with MHYT domain